MSTPDNDDDTRREHAYTTALNMSAEKRNDIAEAVIAVGSTWEDAAERVKTIDDDYCMYLVVGALMVHDEQCDKDECLVCGVIQCPRSEPLHLHHDGCPACTMIEKRR